MSEMSNQNAHTLPAVGARFRLTEAVERFPHFTAPAGAAGTVTDASPHVVCMHMDDYLPGAEDWDNEIVWTIDNDYDENGEPAPTPSVAQAFYRDTAPLNEPAIPTDAQTPAQADAEQFERDLQEGCRLAAVDGFTDDTGAPSRFSVSCRGTHIGDVFFHEATRGTSGLAGAPHWAARTRDGQAVIRTASGVSTRPEPTSGERTREAAVALLVAADHAA